MRMPVPFSGSASSLGKIGTGARKSGVTARRPKRCVKRASEGCAVTPTQAASSSGRVVAITNSSSDPSTPKAT
jgi:hypothetical protein